VGWARVSECSPTGHAVEMTELRRLPWRLVVIPALLGVALGVSVANGRTGDAVIIAVMMVLGLVLFAAAAFLGITRRDRRSGG